MPDFEPPAPWLCEAVIAAANLHRRHPQEAHKITRATTLLRAAEREDLPTPKMRLSADAAACVEIHFRNGDRQLVVCAFADYYACHAWNKEGKGRASRLHTDWRERWRAMLEWLKPGREENAAATVANLTAGDIPW